MPCKIDHEAPGMVPRYLCRICMPRGEAARPTCTEASSKAPVGIPKNRLRRLRAEERRLSDLIDDIGRRDPARTKKLYAAIKAVEDDITRCFKMGTDRAQ